MANGGDEELLSIGGAIDNILIERQDACPHSCGHVEIADFRVHDQKVQIPAALGQYARHRTGACEVVAGHSQQ